MHVKNQITLRLRRSIYFETSCKHHKWIEIGINQHKTTLSNRCKNYVIVNQFIQACKYYNKTLPHAFPHLAESPSYSN